MNLIISGTGRVGGAVARTLLADSAPVRVGARNPGRLAELRALGAEIAQVDLTDPATLEPALRGVTHVLATAHAMTGRGANGSRQVDLLGNRALIDAARRAGVRRFVFISAQGARADHPVDFYRHKFAAEEHLRASGLHYTILRPAAFMEVWGEIIGKGAMTGGKATLFGPGTNPVSFISERDVITLCLMALHNELGDTTLEVGAENRTFTQVAELYGRVAGKEVRLSHIPVPALRLMATLITPFHEGTARLMRAATQMATADMTLDPALLLRILQRPPVTFEEVAHQTAASLRAVQTVG